MCISCTSAHTHTPIHLHTHTHTHTHTRIHLNLFQYVRRRFVSSRSVNREAGDAEKNTTRPTTCRSLARLIYLGIFFHHWRLDRCVRRTMCAGRGGELSVDLFCIITRLGAFFFSFWFSVSPLVSSGWAPRGAISTVADLFQCFCLFFGGLLCRNQSGCACATQRADATYRLSWIPDLKWRPRARARARYF